jgi:hypothetical protein
MMGYGTYNHNIPKEWLRKIARKKDIERLAERLGNKYAKNIS